VNRVIKELKRSLFFALPILALGYGVCFSSGYHIDETILYDYICPEDTHTYDYASLLEFCRGTNPDSCPLGVFLGTNPHWPESLFWSHALPSGLQVPPYTIFRAKLWIDGLAVNTENNSVEIQGTVGWEPLDHQVHDNVTYDLTEASEEGFWNPDSLSVIIRAGESLVRIDHAKLLLDYDSPPTDVQEEDLSSRGDGFGLSQNYPNPFNPETEISFSLRRRASVSLVLYNVFGQKVRVLVDATLPPGSHTVTWDGTDGEGIRLASGVYFCRLSAGGNTSTSKIILLK
jgi:hypothetical protein